MIAILASDGPTAANLVPAHGGGMIPETGAALLAVASRPDAVRQAAVADAMRQAGIPHAVLVVGSDDDGPLLDEAGLPRARDIPGPFAGTAAGRTAAALAAVEPVLTTSRPALLLLPGDSDAALACGLAAAKLDIPVVRLGGGVRCGDFSLHEEINRVLLDRLSDRLLVQGLEAVEALEAEGIQRTRIHHVGSTVVDLVRRTATAVAQRAPWEHYDLTPGGYLLATLQRVDNVGDPQRVSEIVGALCGLTAEMPVILAVEPQAVRILEAADAPREAAAAGVRLATGLDYVDALGLKAAAGAVLTDSDVVQEEAFTLGIRCFMLRRPGRPMPFAQGGTVLLGNDPAEIGAIRLDCEPPEHVTAPMWDGLAARRVAAALEQDFSLMRSDPGLWSGASPRGRA